MLGRCLDGAPIDEDDKDDLPGIEGLATVPPSDAIVGRSGRVYRSSSLLGLAIFQEPRRFCIALTEWHHFDTFILCVIIANCATMAWESPCDPPGTWKASFINGCEWLYLIIFTFELLIKVVAYGFLFIHDAYLHDPWCQLDFIVVTLAWVPIFLPSFGNYSVIRSVRALRPLRALKRMPGMPVLVSSLFAAIPRLANVAALCGLLVLFLGIVGTGEFSDALHYRCARPGFEPSDGIRSLSTEAHVGATPPARFLHRRQLRTAGAYIAVNPWDTTRFCDPKQPVESCLLEGADEGTRCAYFDHNINYGALT